MNRRIDGGLAGKTALVTGGSRGLGLAAARAIGLAGGRLVITARKVSELEEARAELQAQGIEVLAIPHDLGRSGASSTIVEKAIDRFGTIDVLVNNAGMTWGGPAAVHSLDAWRRVVDVNLNGTFELTQTVASQVMIPRQAGVILFITSIAALGANQVGGVPTISYNATKAAQVNIVKSLAAEWGQYGIRVNALAPGWFVSRMTAATLEARRQAFLARIPLGRFGDPDTDYDGPLLFLVSDASRYVTGATLVLDGGMTTTL